MSDLYSFSLIFRAILTATGLDGTEFPAFHGKGGMDRLGDISLPSSQPWAEPFLTLQGLCYSCFPMGHP